MVSIDVRMSLVGDCQRHVKDRRTSHLRRTRWSVISLSHTTWLVRSGGRVDIINGLSGTPTVLEIELIDPYLSLDMEPAAATRMAKSVMSA